MKRFAVDVPIWATMYFNAESELAALVMLQNMHRYVLSCPGLGVEDHMYNVADVEWSRVATLYTTGDADGSTRPLRLNDLEEM